MPQMRRFIWPRCWAVRVSTGAVLTAAAADGEPAAAGVSAALLSVLGVSTLGVSGAALPSVTVTVASAILAKLRSVSVTVQVPGIMAS